MRLAARPLLAACLLLTVAATAHAQLPIANGLSQASAFDDTYGVGRFIEGGYQIAARQGLSRWFWYNGFIPSAVRYELTTTLRGGPNGEGYGITFGRASRDVTQWCAFLIDADGHYKLISWGGNEAVPWRQSSAIITGMGGRNVLAVQISGRQVQLLINGTQVDSWTADRDVSGFMGVEVGQGVEVRFENYTAYAWGGGAAPVLAGGAGKTVPGMAPVSAAVPMGGGLMWSEDFSSFPVADDEIARSLYAEGGLLVTARQGMTRWLFGRGIVPSNVRISVNAQFRGGPTNTGYGVTFGRPSRDERTWMVFDVRQDGNYYLEGYGATNNVGPSPSGAVQRGFNSVNQLTVEVRGSQVTMYVNGQVVNSYAASRDATGYVGVHVAQGTSVLFTNLRVERLN